MIAKIVLFFGVVAAAHAAVLLNSGVLSPGLLNSGIVGPGLLNSGIVGPGLLSSPIATSSVIATPGAITTDRRIIGTTGLIAGSPLTYSPGLISNGLIGASPLGLRSGILSPIGLRSAGILAGPGLVQTILK